ncbi:MULTISPECIES: nitrogenase component 1 [unclassified Clostridium]|uniref:nitrogenase component 1 n=1 Tax=unclassified Clostridium TaxID=2614128 RepID=UPI0025C32DB0|nr:MULTISPECIES: nitrogenase component 1 [unclassified Clostridium]
MEELKKDDDLKRIREKSVLRRAIHKDSCNEVIDLALKIPDIHVLVLGPESCLRVLYFRAFRKELLDRFYMLNVTNIDLITNNHMESLKSALESIVVDSNYTSKGIIIYISCSDIVMGTDFTSGIQYIEEKYKVPVKIFQRGPLSKRRMLPKERLSNIFAEILEFHNKSSNDLNKKAVNILGEERISKDSSLYKIINKSGYDKINDFCNLNDFEDFMKFSRSNINIVTHKFGINLAKNLEKKYNIPYCFIPQKYILDDLRINYLKLSEFLAVKDDFENIEKEFEKYLMSIPEDIFHKRLAVGLKDNSLEIAISLLQWGFDVRVVFIENISMEQFEKIKSFENANEIKIYTNSFLKEKNNNEFKHIEIAIGEYAINKYPNAKHVNYKESYDISFENIKNLIGDLI